MLPFSLPNSYFNVTSQIMVKLHNNDSLQPITLPTGVTLRSPEDFNTLRNSIYETAKNNITSSFPSSYNGVRAELTDVDYADEDDVSVEAQKAALMQDKSVTRRLRGTINLINEADGTQLDTRTLTLMRVPHLTQRGTFINNGSEYNFSNQARLLHGAYSRRQSNGELETQFNIKPGTGRAFRVGFEPETAQYRLRIGGSNLHLYSMLKDMGVEDSSLEKTWGPQILSMNKNKYDAKVFPKAYQNLVPTKLQIPDATHDMQVEALHSALDNAKVHARAVARTLPGILSTKAASKWRAGIGIKMAELSGISFTPDLPPNEAALQMLEIVNPEIFYQLPNVKNAAGFSPDLSSEDMQPAYDAIYAHAGPQLAGMKKWPEKWFPAGSDNLGWVSWYMKYADGETTSDDERQINRWKSFKARHTPQFLSAPTARRAFALRYWAIDPLKLIKDPEQKKSLKADMDSYRKKQLQKFHGGDTDAMEESLKKNS